MVVAGLPGAEGRVDGAADVGAARDPDPREPGDVHFPGAGVVVVGDHATQHNYFHGAGRVARAAYLEQVRGYCAGQAA